MTPTRLCIVGHDVPGLHREGCPIEGCAGCMPAVAVSDLQVCGWHERRILDGLDELPGLWVDLADPRRSKPLGGVRSASTGSPMLISDDARHARSAIKALLASWCLVLAEDYAMRVPADTVEAMAAHVRQHAPRLLNSEHADQLCADLLGHVDEDGDRYEGAAHLARRLAHPSPAARQRIRCDCGDWVRVDPDQVMTCRTCGTWGVLGWWMARAEVPSGPMTLRELADWLLAYRGLNVPHHTLRTWADRGLITPVSTEGARRFDPIAVATVAQARIYGRTA